MADGGNAVKQTIAEMPEMVAKPVVDEVGKALEVGVQSVMGNIPSQQDLQKQQQKKAEDEKKKRDLQWRIQQITKVEEDIKQVRDKKQQELQQKNQEVKQQEEVKQFEVVQTQNQLAKHVKDTQRKTELRKGVGG